MRPKQTGLYVFLTRGSAVVILGGLLWLVIPRVHKGLASSQLSGPGPKTEAPVSLNTVEHRGRRVLPQGSQKVAQLHLNGVIGNGEPSAETGDTADTAEENTAVAIPVPDPDVEVPASHPKVGRPSAHDESSSPSGNMFIVPLAPIGGLAASTVLPTGASTNTAGSTQNTGNGQNSAGGPTSSTPSIANPPGNPPSNPPAPPDPGPGPIVTPEPGTITLVSSGLLAMWFIRRRWKRLRT